MKDLCPFQWSYYLSEHEGDSTESELLDDLRLTLSGDYPDTSSTESGAGEPNDLSSDEDKAYVAPHQWSTRQKRPAPGCIGCDHEIRGECSEMLQKSEVQGCMYFLQY